MGAIGGLFQRTGAPVDVQAAEKLRKALGPYALSGTATLRPSGPVALVHAALPATPEALGEEQPVDDRHSKCQLVFEGRLDNRAELLASMRLSPNSSDAELALCAFLKWDTDFCRHLLGDFALAVWDPRNRRVLGARDAIGVKPFYYGSCGSQFVWSTELAAVLSTSLLSLEPNEVAVAEQLLYVPFSLTDTLYAGVERLPPAHLLIADESGVRVTRYWDIDPERQIRYRSREEYVAHLRTLLTEAVRCRMRTVGPVFSELSGGLDSSTITVLANSMSASESTRVEALSTLYTGYECDESAFIDAVVQWSGVPSCRFGVAPAATYDYAKEARDTMDRPRLPVPARTRPARYEHVRRSGGRVVLAGNGGDEWFSGTSLIFADDLWSLRWGTLARRLAAISSPRSPLSAAWSYGLLPLLTSRTPPGLRRGLARARDLLRGRRPPDFGRSSINPSFATRISLTNRRPAAPDPSSWGGLSRAHVYGYLGWAWFVQGLEQMTRWANQTGVDLRMPLHDRRIVEFPLAIPPVEWTTPTETKAILRRVAGPLLPPEVAGRAGKADFSTLMTEEILALSSSVLRSPLLTEREGWIDVSVLRGELAGLRHLHRSGDRSYRASQWQLWHALAIEIWYRACFSPDTRLE